MPYSQNLAQLHTDASRAAPQPAGPGRRGTRWSAPGVDRAEAVTVTYDLTRLMRLPDSADGTRYLVTLGAPDLVDPSTVIATLDYEHPIYTPASVAAQQRLAEIDSDRLVFAGAWQGWGFHEDGARSGAAAAERLGLRLAAAATRGAGSPRLYRSTITHTRRDPAAAPLPHHRTHLWVVDLDDLPDHGVRLAAGTFEARDHLGDPAPEHPGERRGVPGRRGHRGSAAGGS